MVNCEDWDEIEADSRMTHGCLGACKWIDVSAPDELVVNSIAVDEACRDSSL